MPGFRSILVDVDAAAAVHPAMDQAVALARACGARLKVVDVLNLPAHARRDLPPGAEEGLISAQRDRLAQLARTAPDVPMQTEILHGRPATALIREVLRSGHDLLIRAHARDAAVPRPRYGAIDMELFRQCPCPVWAAWAGSRTRPQRLLVAVNAAAEEVEEQALNRKIVEIALAIAPESASVVLLQAWTAFAEEILRSHSTAEQLAAYVEAAERRARGALDNLTATLPRGTARFRVEMLKGHPEEVIPQFVVSEGIDLVVMGTVARTGIAGLLIGNTAERLLQRLITSVLAVKPDGFVSPVRAEP